MSLVNGSAIWQLEPGADGYRLYRDGVFLSEVGSVDEYQFEMDAEVGDTFQFSIEAIKFQGSNVLVGPRTNVTATVEQEVTP